MTTKRVLVIDDEADIRAILQGCLEDIAAWDVVTAISGEMGLERAVMDHPDGILLDICMPGMGGLTALQKLQENPTTDQIPIILLTAKVLAEEQEDFAHLRVAGLIMKPFDPMTIVDQVAMLFGWEF